MNLGFLAPMLECIVCIPKKVDLRANEMYFCHINLMYISCVCNIILENLFLGLENVLPVVIFSSMRATQCSNNSSFIVSCGSFVSIS